MGEKAPNIDAIRKAIETYFGFLLDIEGFDGSEYRPDGTVFHLRGFSVEVLYEERERYIVSLVSKVIDYKYVRAEVSCLYVEGGLGPAQRVGWDARTSHALKKSLNSQARAVRELLPWLRESAYDSLFLVCSRR